MNDDKNPLKDRRTRRDVLRQGILTVTGAVGFAAVLEALSRSPSTPSSPVPRPTRPVAAVPGDPVSAWEDITGYNNYYEFGLEKTDPARLAGQLVTEPWTVTIDGMVQKPITLDIATLMKRFPPEDRTYRMRCVEGWSKVVPWWGIPLGQVIKAANPMSGARYVKFTALADPEVMPGVRAGVLDFPYIEGLRMDEAMHPFTLLAVGIDGQPLPKQNGAPLRLVVPWKYGFKNIKAIVKITLQAEQPTTTWSTIAPNEYGFYANVNPEVDHPRWSQATERRLGELGRRPTLMFNGYASEVQELYAGMDLRRFF